jgi:hypothetical protein
MTEKEEYENIVKQAENPIFEPAKAPEGPQSYHSKLP